MALTTIVSTAAVLCAVLAVILLTGRLARLTGFSRTTHHGRLAVLETLSLDPRRRLLLVRCDGRCVLLLAGQNDQVLGWLPEPLQ